ncbi:MAG TPA: GIY-YIG nuclease family protein [Clostridia bacterium]|nr:GIY-YIG nuclease family protein [Clostridia bacterium]
MDKKDRKELLEKFKQIKDYMGVVKITNTINGKIFVEAYPNLKNKWISMKSQLDQGRHPNSQLQKEWKEMGAEAFTYEVLEQKESGDITDMKWELKQTRKPWLEKLRPYGDKGYNKPPEE